MTGGRRHLLSRARRRDGAMQVAFAVRAPVRRDRLDELREVLWDMGRRDAARGDVARVPFPELSGVHFGRLLLLDDAHDSDGKLIPASLVLMTEVDAPLARHIAELSDLAGPGMDAAFGLCEGYPATPDPAARRRFLGDHRLRPRAAYVNTVGRTVQQVRQEQELREAIVQFVDRHRDGLPDDPLALRAEIQRFVLDTPGLEWARRRAPQPPLRERLHEKAHALGVGAGLLLASPLAIAALPLVLVILRIHEMADRSERERPDPAHERSLSALEDFGAQNPFSAVGLVKPGPFRRGIIAVVLFLIDFAARHVFVRGNLAGVKTIHFARWTVLDGWRRAIFTSNYDGSLESYMDDFIDKVAFGLNASFSNGVGYPKTRFLLLGGARREEEFKHWLRRRQIPTQVWYSAYDRLSARNIENNALVRSGLFGTLAESEVRAWLQRL